MQEKGSTHARKEVAITTEFIKLEAFLKFAGAVSTGGEAKNLIQDSLVRVNGEVCTMCRGKKLRPRDTVELRNDRLTVR